MKIRKIVPILILSLLVSAPAGAQKRNNKKKKTDEVEETAQQRMYREMLPSTQKIMFVDSVDATRKDFMKHIKLSHDIGSIVTYSEFFDKEEGKGCYGFVNGFGNKCYFSIPTKKGIKLFSLDKLDGKWKDQREIKELNDFAKSINHPYMMTDGMTLYFSAKSDDKGLGGYDIFVTSFDTESGTFLEPQNIGMPFNSPANDFMFVVDDVNNVGWFVTDRNKKDDHVTVYTFVPSDVRTNYDIEKLGEEKVESFARIDNYKATWTNKKERDRVIEKIKSINSDDLQNNNGNSMWLPINDNVVYTSAEQFKSKDARAMYNKLLLKEKAMGDIEKSLSEKRIKYHVSPESARSKMAPDILKSEKLYEQMIIEARQIRKDVINLENKSLK